MVYLKNKKLIKLYLINNILLGREPIITLYGRNSDIDVTINMSLLDYYYSNKLDNYNYEQYIKLDSDIIDIIDSNNICINTIIISANDIEIINLLLSLNLIIIKPMINYNGMIPLYSTITSKYINSKNTSSSSSSSSNSIVRCVGECGLDYTDDFPTSNFQLPWFK